ncbi:hypothetical protein HAT2_00564 [Candidatus Similichlamydia laticola]|uniref:Uncharacterized protein n=1 Tax=Candidatus Similichlamydia laticola TaxID=2170265 RepID=A0A369KCK6_9BACT|nr:hypothetical protein HAT2_00564 [Candidatus Similichlamydia laticola]
MKFKYTKLVSVRREIHNFLHQSYETLQNEAVEIYTGREQCSIAL